MCTVSIFLDKGKLLLTASRDESRTRGEDGVKQFHHNGNQCIYPIDTKSKGTWLGVNDCGIVAAILNMYQVVDHQGSHSRGLIIPELLKHKSLSQVDDYLQSLDAKCYSPFVLLVLNNATVYRYCWNGVSMQKENLSASNEFEHGYLESSSSVDTDLTIAYRQQLFQQWKQDKPENNLAVKILEFHLTRDENEQSASVCMARSRGHTKSISQVMLSEHAAEFHYLAPEKLEAMVNTSLSETELNALETIKFNLQKVKSSTNFSTNVCSV